MVIRALWHLGDDILRMLELDDVVGLLCGCCFCASMAMLQFVNAIVAAVPLLLLSSMVVRVSRRPPFLCTSFLCTYVELKLTNMRSALLSSQS